MTFRQPPPRLTPFLQAPVTWIWWRRRLTFVSTHSESATTFSPPTLRLRKSDGTPHLGDLPFVRHRHEANRARSRHSTLAPPSGAPRFEGDMSACVMEKTNFVVLPRFHTPTPVSLRIQEADHFLSRARRPPAAISAPLRAMIGSRLLPKAWTHSCQVIHLLHDSWKKDSRWERAGSSRTLLASSRQGKLTPRWQLVGNGDVTMGQRRT